MIFDTFLFRFELRTGCIVMGILHLLLSVGALENVAHQKEKKVLYLVLSERLFEIFLSVFLMYASAASHRVLLRFWMLSITPVYLFNILYSGYESLVKYDSILGLLLLFTIYVLTISLMLVHSFYDELGYIENHLKDLAELRALRSAQQQQQQQRDTQISEDSKMEMVQLNAFDKKAVRTDGSYLASDSLGTPNRRSVRTFSTGHEETESSVDMPQRRRARSTVRTSQLHTEEESAEVAVQPNRTPSEDSEMNQIGTPIPRSRHSSEKQPKTKRDSN